MKKLFSIILFLISSIAYTQTWTESVGYPTATIYEFTVITSEQYQRLLEQYKYSNDYCALKYTDALAIRSGTSWTGGQVTSGTLPVLNGYYYVLKTKRSLTGSNPSLIVGNTNTGRLELEFTKGYMLANISVRIDSNEYISQYNRYIGWINNSTQNSSQIISLTPPTNLRASSIRATTCTLTWTSVQGATGYYVYWSETANGNYVRIGSPVYSPETEFNVIEMYPNTANYFKVTAFNGSNESNKSSYILVNTTRR